MGNDTVESMVDTIVDELSVLKDDELRYIKSRDIASFLQILEIQLDVIFERSKIWSITNSFMQKYPKLLINSDLFISFLSDLYELDFLGLIEDQVLLNDVTNHGIKIEDTVLDNEIFASSPIRESSPIVSNQIIKEEQDELDNNSSIELLQKRIDEKIEDLSNIGSNEKKTTSIGTEKLPDIEKNLIFNGTEKEFETSSYDTKPSRSSVIFLIVFAINVTLLFLLLAILLLITSSSLRKKVLGFLLNNEPSDLYWWQKVPFLEKHTWEMLELLRSYEKKDL